MSSVSDATGTAQAHRGGAGEQEDGPNGGWSKVAWVRIRPGPGGSFDIEVSGNFENRLLRDEIRKELRRAVRESEHESAGLPVPHPSQVADVLNLATGICKTLERRAAVSALIEPWTPEQRREACRWAMATHAYAFHDCAELLLPELPHVRALEEAMRDGGRR